MFTFEEVEKMSRRRDEARLTGVWIYASGSRSWSVSVGISRREHRKTIRGTKKEAKAYADWIKGLVAAGHSVTSTVSQSELKELGVLQAKADRLRMKLKAAVSAGAKIEPGALTLDRD